MVKAPHSRNSEQTRRALIRAGLTRFGEMGFAGASTREIARAAGANIGSIAYHFGGKEGLHAACAEFVVETIGSVADRALNAPAPMPASPQAARDRLGAVLERMISFLMVRPEAGEIVQFVLRELSNPTAALDIIYHGVFEPTHRRLCALWAEATGEQAESERTRIVVFSLIGQVVYFRIARAAVLRRMGWQQVGEEESAAVAHVARTNLEAMLRAWTGARA